MIDQNFLAGSFVWVAIFIAVLVWKDIRNSRKIVALEDRVKALEERKP